jgi:hypothetical protein
MVGRCDTKPERYVFADYVERVVAEAPPLSAAQRADLRELLRPVVIARRERLVTR